MTSSLELSALFLEHAKVPLDLAGHPDKLERLLWQAYESARSHWEHIALSAGDFVRHLAERLEQRHDGKPIEEILAEWHLADLYLACACVHGVPGALEAFDRYYLAKLSMRLANGRHTASTIDDVCQQLRMDFLLPTATGALRIAQYKGYRPLLNMLVVSAIRLAQRISSRNRPDAEEGMDLVEALSAGGDAELDLIKRRHHREFCQALDEVLRRLPNEERYLLTLYWIEQLPMTKLAANFGTHHSTISRRLSSIRVKIRDETKRLVQERLHLSDSEFESLLAVVKSQLDVRSSQLF